MKTSLSILASSLFLLAACNNNLPEENSSTSSSSPDYITFKLGGEFMTTSESPLASAPMELIRASGDLAKTLYAINVTKSGTPYAYGLFDDLSKIKMAIAKENNTPFNFEVTVVTEGGDKLSQEEGAYAEPFILSDASTFAEVTNRFVPNSMLQFKDLKKGETLVQGQDATIMRPRMDRYYGSKTFSNPGNEGGTITIDLKRTAFGLKFNVIPPYKGTVTLKFLDRILTVNAADPVTMNDEFIYTFSEVEQAATADEESGMPYEESIPLDIEWTGLAGGKTVKKQETITAKRKTMTTINIDFSSSSDFTFNLTLEDKELKQESQDINISERQ